VKPPRREARVHPPSRHATPFAEPTRAASRGLPASAKAGRKLKLHPTSSTTAPYHPSPLLPLPSARSKSHSHASQHDGHGEDKGRGWARRIRVAESVCHASCSNWPLILPIREILIGNGRHDTQGHERCQTSPALPRFLRTSSHPIEPVSGGGVLSAVEVRGMVEQPGLGLNRRPRIQR
jgi:hypothetical protein